MRVPLVDLKAQYVDIKPEINAAIERILDNTSFILGSEVAEFEDDFAGFIGVDGAVGVASGTAALKLALVAYGIGPGNEVITTAHTFMATAEVISQVGATPVFVDIDPLTYNIDPQMVASAVTPRTKAIIPVHLYGQPVDMDPLLEIAKANDLALIEDAAQAHGAEYKGRRCGSIGDLACFSFYPGKNLGAYGDGGAVTGNDRDLLDRVRRLRDHGRTTKYSHDDIGYSERLDALQAAVLSVKLPKLEAWTEERRKHAKSYGELLSECDVVLPYEAEYARHVYHLYVIRVRNRDQVMEQLQKDGIGAGIHYPIPLHRQPAYLDLGYDKVTLPVTERVAEEVLSLPIYPEISENKIAYVVEAVKKAIRKC